MLIKWTLLFNLFKRGCNGKRLCKQTWQMYGIFLPFMKGLQSNPGKRISRKDGSYRRTLIHPFTRRCSPPRMLKLSVLLKRVARQTFGPVCTQFWNFRPPYQPSVDLSTEVLDVSFLTGYIALQYSGILETLAGWNNIFHLIVFIKKLLRILHFL